jgi:hypothetical protein
MHDGRPTNVACFGQQQNSVSFYLGRAGQPVVGLASLEELPALLCQSANVLLVVPESVAAAEWMDMVPLRPKLVSVLPARNVRFMLLHGEAAPDPSPADVAVRHRPQRGL